MTLINYYSFQVAPEALEDFDGLACPSDETPNAVVIGLAPTEFHYNRLNEAFRYANNIFRKNSTKFLKIP